MRHSVNVFSRFLALACFSIILAACQGGDIAGQTDKTLVSVEIQPSSAEVAVGDAAAFHVVGTYDDGSKATLSSASWQTTNATVADVVGQSSGAISVSPAAEGSAVITVAVDGVAPAAATVTATRATAALSKISLSTPNLSVLVNGQGQLTLTAAYSGGSSKTISSGADWVITDGTIASVTSTGLVRGKKQGQTTVTVTYNGKVTSATINVSSTVVSVASLSASPSSVSVNVNAQASVAITANMDDQTTQVVTTQANWVVGNALIASMSGGGLIKGLAKGQTTITATYGGKSTTINVTVNQANTSNIAQIQIYPSTLTTGSTSPQQAVAVGVTNDGQKLPLTQLVSWSVADASVARVAAGGVVTVLKMNGATDLTATYSGVTGHYALENNGVVLPSTFTLFLKKPANYPQAYIYIWTDKAVKEPAGAWPGTAMVSASEYGSDWFKFVVSDDKYVSNDGMVHFKFNGGANAAQSAKDLTRAKTAGSQWWTDDVTGLDIPPGGSNTNTKMVKVKAIGDGTFIYTDANPTKNVVEGTFPVGTVLNVRAPDAPIGSAFDHWAGDAASYLVDASKSITKLVVVAVDVMTLQAQFATSNSSVDTHRNGRTQYAKLCASCHGDKGQGANYMAVTANALPLKYSTQAALAKYISDQMPFGSPSLCIGSSKQGDCAYDIAAMILADSWTAPSTGAQCNATSLQDMVPADRNLRLLTKEEYFNTVTDLFGISFAATLTDPIPADGTALNYNTASFLLADGAKTAGYAAVAETIAAQVLQRKSFSSLASGCGSTDTDCIVRTFGKKAFRRPLSTDEITRIKALYSDTDKGSTVIQALLLSPNFLYRSEMGQKDAVTGYYRLSNYEVAALLSYTFWATTPDDALLSAADQSSFDVKAQAERLLNSARAKAAMRRFAKGWMIQDQYPFPAISSISLQDAMKEETVQFIVNAIAGNLKYDDLLTANYTYVNGELAKYYGMVSNASQVTGWQRMDYTDPHAANAGILAHGSFLATRTSTAATSPIKRGVFVRKALLCQEFPAPVAANVAIKPSQNESTRDATERHTSDPACQSCHQFIDNLGFGFERFGPDARSRTQELIANAASIPVNANGEINSLDSAETTMEAGPGASFNSLSQLSSMVADSPNGPGCFVRQVYRYATGRKEARDDECTIRVFGEKFRNGQQSLSALMVELTQTKNYVLRK